ncbi:hypothetical protein BDD12DRAFT_148138 [Trichophaea hybrida]|nr:hypothetical protein BDD12DRAFT_148138 [Trichophaea hybrida]
MENRDRLGAGNSSSKQDFWRRGSSSAAATTTKATFTTSSTPSSTNHQRKLSSASTRTTGSTGITRPRSLTVTKSAKEHSQPPPTTSRHRRLSSTSVTCTSAQPATSSCSAISRVAQRTNNPPPSLSRSATAPVLSRHEVVTVVHTDKESYPRNVKLIDKKGTTQSANARISSSAPPNKPLKPSSTVLPPTASKLQQPTTVRISHQHRHTPSVTTPTTNLPINPAHLTAPNTTTTQSTNSSPNQDPNSLNVSSSRPGSSHASARSSPTPPKKHAPARFSSNGVETSGGPPPS